VIFQVLTAADMKMVVFWDIVPCNLGEIDRFSDIHTVSINRAMEASWNCKHIEEECV
jgi:hypothetical protein